MEKTDLFLTFKMNAHQIAKNGFYGHAVVEQAYHVYNSLRGREGDLMVQIAMRRYEIQIKKHCSRKEAYEAGIQEIDHQMYKLLN